MKKKTKQRVMAWLLALLLAAGLLPTEVYGGVAKVQAETGTEASDADGLGLEDLDTVGDTVPGDGQPSEEGDGSTDQAEVPTDDTNAGGLRDGRAADNGINVVDSNADNGQAADVPVPYAAAGELDVMQIGTAAENGDFLGTKKIFGQGEPSESDTHKISISDSEILSENGYIQLLKGENASLFITDNNNHGMQFTKEVTFVAKVPANAMGIFTLDGCEYTGAQAWLLVDDNLVIDKQPLKKTADKATDEKKTFAYKNNTSDVAEIQLKVDASNGYLHSISYEVTAIPSVATVSGTVGAEVKGGTLTFKGTSSYTTTVEENGTYSIELPIGAEYQVELSGVAGYKLVDAKVDLTNTGAGDAVTGQDFTPAFWNAAKTGTVTIGGTTFTITPGAAESDDFSVVASGGDGEVELATNEVAIIWANLGGAGKGSVSAVDYSEGLTGKVSSSSKDAGVSEIALTFAGEDMPKGYTLWVKDNSASGVPVKDGAVKVYNLGDGSVISTLYHKDNGRKISGSVTSTDKLVTFTGNKRISYNGGGHGIIICDTDEVSVKVAGNATVTFSLCQYSKSGATITAAASTGTIGLSTDASKNVADMLVGTDGASVTFDYKGEAATLTFTVGGTAGTSYIHSISVTNEAEKTSVNEGAVKVKPEIITSLGSPSSLTVTPNGQTLNLAQTGGSRNDKSTASYYAFPKVADFNKLELEVKVNSITSASDNYGVWVGAIDDALSLATVRIANMTKLNGYYTKGPNNDGTGKVSKVLKEQGEVVKFTIYKNDGAFYINTNSESTGDNSSEFKYGASDVTIFQANGSSSEVYYGLMLAGVNCDIMNMTYYDKDGNVLYDQNAYYNPLGTAPTVSSVAAKGAEDRTRIDVTWEGTQVFGDGKFVLQVSKDGSAYADVKDEDGNTVQVTGYSYAYPVASDASGEYKFRVCGTLGNSKEQIDNNRTAYVESNSVTIEAALETPVLTLPYTSAADKVSLRWTEVPSATSYEVWRRSSDETESKMIAAVTDGTSYADTDIEAEVPYYYYIIAKSSDNFSNPGEESWTLPTSGHTGTYSYGDAEIAVTKRSYDTVFKNTITLEGLATAPGTLKVEVNGKEAAVAQIARANDTFSFPAVELQEGRNDVTLYLEYGNGKKARKSFNFVYLTNYDYVVDASFTGTPGDTADYGVPQYATVAEAISAVGASNASRKVILVREGEYKERLDITTPNISLIGEDSEKTIIHCYPGDYDSEGVAGGKTDKRCAVYVEKAAVNFSAENLTFKNDYVYTGGSGINESADVVRSDAEGAVYVNVRFLGYQDTILANNGHQYYEKCYVAGNVDFIYGDYGMALFNDCDIVFRYNAKKNSGYVTAMRTPEEQAYGLVFKDCRILAEKGCSGSKYYLGRPWGEYAATTFIDCYMSDIINADLGYSTWGGQDFATDLAALAKTRYFECGTYGPGYAVGLSRRQISRAKAASMVSTSGLGWDPYTATGKISSGNYVGAKTTTPNDKFVENIYESDEYSPYEGDDTDLGRYDQEGYAQSAATTGGGLLKENNANYYQVATGEEFLDAMLKIRTSGMASVIELTADIGLGSKEIKNFENYSAIITGHSHPPLTHPALMETGVSKLNIKGMSNLTIFSKNGSSIKHTAVDINGSKNIIIRNIAFDELWEWDEETAGDYDINDWDYVTVQNGSSRVWIDHCTFYKAYDGIVDMKTNASSRTDVTVSWCEFLPGSKGNTFFDQMMDTMAANPGQYPYYKSLLDKGMTDKQIWWYAYGQKKTHLLGENDNATANSNLNATFANNYYFDSMDRMPRLRFGNAHVYNCIMDAQELYDAKKGITDADAARHIVSNGASSTCGGSLLVENSYINGIINALNSGNGGSPAGYINAKNSLYYIDGQQYALVPKVNTTYPGAEVLLLNADAFVSSLPYSGYTLYDAAKLDTEVKPYAGAGKLKGLTTLQWEKTAYYDSQWTPPTDLPGYDNEGLKEFVTVVGTNEIKLETLGEIKVVDTDGKEISSGTVQLVAEEGEGESVQAAKQEMDAAIAKNETLSSLVNKGAGIKYYDIYLKVSLTDQRVKMKEGRLLLIFPYPAGTSKDGYDFKVLHVKDGGVLEDLPPVTSEEGIRVEVDSLSPFAIVYTAKQQQGTDTPPQAPGGDDDDDDDSPGELEKDGGDSIESAPANKPTQKAAAKSPRTYDDSPYDFVSPSNKGTKDKQEQSGQQNGQQDGQQGKQQEATLSETLPDVLPEAVAAGVVPQRNTVSGYWFVIAVIAALIIAVSGVVLFRKKENETEE